MQRIICLIESLSSGGAERQMTYLASELKKANYDVEVWTYYPDDFYLPILQKNNVPYRYIPKAQRKWQRISILRRELKKAKPDIVITYLTTACIVACIIKATGGKFKLIVSERNTTQKLTLRERIKFFCYRFADYIVPNSYTQGELINNNYPNLHNKVKVITNFIDTDRFIPQKKEKTDKHTSIIVVGRVLPQKNPLMLMQAIKILQDKGLDPRVTWFGEYKDRQFAQICLNKINELGIEQSFIFMPPIPNIAEEYPKYDLFCLPSIFEGFPNVLCEAMSCGLLVVCSNVCDNPNIVVNGENGYLFDPMNAKDIACQIEKIALLFPKQRQQMGSNNRKRILEIFSQNAFIDKYISLIEM